MAYVVKTMKDGTGADFNVLVWAAGRDLASNSAPVALDNESFALLTSLNSKAQANYLAYASTTPAITTAALSVIGVYDVRGYSVFWMRAQNTGSTALAELLIEEGPTSAGPWTEVVSSWSTLTDGKLMSWAVTSGANPAVTAASASFVIRLDIAGAPFVRIRARQATSDGSLVVDASASRF